MMPLHRALDRVRALYAGSLHTRLVLLAAAVAAILATGFQLLAHQQEKQLAVVLEGRQEEAGRTIRGILALRGASGALLARDYTAWDDMVEFVNTRDSTWKRVNLDETVAVFEVDGGWVLDLSLDLITAVNPSGDPGLEAVPVPRELLGRHLANGPLGHFFALSGDRLLEIWSAWIVPSEDVERLTPPRGYYLVAREWTPERLSELERLANGSLAIRMPGVARFARGRGAPGAEGRDVISVSLPLLGANGRPLRELEFTAPFAVATRVRAAQRATFLLMLAGAALAVTLTVVALTRWVGRPIAAISMAIERGGDRALLNPVARKRGEMGRLAGLVEEFYQQRSELVAAHEEAERATRAKSMFIANASHELRTPMHGILSYARFGVRDAAHTDRADLLEYFRTIEDCGSGLLVLVNDLLDLSKIEAGRMTCNLEDVGIAELATDAIDEFRSSFAERRIQVEFAPDGADHRVSADPLRLAQVFRNLLANAGRFSSPGGTIAVAIEEAGDRVRVSVRDHGPGIPPAELQSIFEPFVQAGRDSGRSGGTGLGLSITREIMKLHHGSVHAENCADGGARFVVELPAMPGAPSPRDPVDAGLPAEVPVA